MVKHLFEVEGFDNRERKFVSECVTYQIEDACKLYREKHLHVTAVRMLKQVNADSEIKIIK